MWLIAIALVVGILFRGLESVLGPEKAEQVGLAVNRGLKSLWAKMCGHEREEPSGGYDLKKAGQDFDKLIKRL